MALHLLVGVAISAYITLGGKLRGTAFKSPGAVAWWHRKTCRILALDASTAGVSPVAPALVVANHVSWLDIIVLGGVLGCDFVSKAEIRSWPVIGWMSHAGGTVFIPRGANMAGRIAAELETRLRAGRSIVVFPEGTTTDGSTLRRFFPRLFAGAVGAQCPVQPTALRYRQGDGPHPVAPFIDDDPFWSHLWRVLLVDRMDVEITLLEALDATDRDRRGLAQEARESIRRVLFPEGDPLA